MTTLSMGIRLRNTILNIINPYLISPLPICCYGQTPKEPTSSHTHNGNFLPSSRGPATHLHSPQQHVYAHSDPTWRKGHRQDNRLRHLVFRDMWSSQKKPRNLKGPCAACVKRRAAPWRSLPSAENLWGRGEKARLRPEEHLWETSGHAQEFGPGAVPVKVACKSTGRGELPAPWG